MHEQEQAGLELIVQVWIHPTPKKEMKGCITLRLCDYSYYVLHVIMCDAFLFNHFADKIVTFVVESVHSFLHKISFKTYIPADLQLIAAIPSEH